MGGQMDADVLTYGHHRAFVTAEGWAKVGQAGGARQLQVKSPAAAASRSPALPLVDQKLVGADPVIVIVRDRGNDQLVGAGGVSQLLEPVGVKSCGLPPR